MQNESIYEITSLSRWEMWPKGLANGKCILLMFTNNKMHSFCYVLIVVVYITKCICQNLVKCMLKAAEFYVCELHFNELTFKNHNFLLKFSYYFPTILFNDLAIQNNVTFYQLNREKKSMYSRSGISHKFPIPKSQ